jgi:hypothetical protein
MAILLQHVGAVISIVLLPQGLAVPCMISMQTREISAAAIVILKAIKDLKYKIMGEIYSPPA